MELEKFKDANRNELSMVEVAHAILSQKGDVMAFADLTNAIQEYLGKSDQEIRDRLAQFYTDLNVDGSFISLGIIFGAYAHGIHLNRSTKPSFTLKTKKKKLGHARSVKRSMLSWLMQLTMMT